MSDIKVNTDKMTREDLLRICEETERENREYFEKKRGKYLAWLSKIMKMRVD